MRIEEMIGARIRQARERGPITQEQLSVLLTERLGKRWTRQAVSLAELGGRALTAAELLAFADALDTPVIALLAPPVGVRTLDLPGGHQVEVDRVLLGLPPKSRDDVDDPMSVALAQVNDLIRANSDYAEGIERIHGALIAMAQWGAPR